MFQLWRARTHAICVPQASCKSVFRSASTRQFLQGEKGSRGEAGVEAEGQHSGCVTGNAFKREKGGSMGRVSHARAWSLNIESLLDLLGPLARGRARARTHIGRQ